MTNATVHLFASPCLGSRKCEYWNCLAPDDVCVDLKSNSYNELENRKLLYFDMRKNLKAHPKRVKD